MYENADILITDKKISSIQEILPFLEKIAQKGKKELVIIAEEVDGDALTTLVVNKIRGTFSALAIKAPGYGDRREEMLEDIAILTGGTVISEDTGRTFEGVKIEDLGRADKIWADKDNCRIIGGKGQVSGIKARISQLKDEITRTTSDFDREKLEERLAKLSGGVAVINVGAATEVELNDKKERVKDAVGATKAAVEEGIVPGGEVTLIRAARILNSLKLNGEEKVGLDILRYALEQPFRWLLKNAAMDDGYFLKLVLEAKEADFGVNVATGDTGSMYKFGVIDPAKVTRLALQNAASVGTMILTTESLVTEIPEKKDTPGVGAGGGMGGMGGGMEDY